MSEPNSNHLSFAAEFPGIDLKKWRELVDATLWDTSFDKRLVSHSYDGLRIEPLYPRAAGATPTFAHNLSKAWTVMQRIDHRDPSAANAQILEDIENGVTGLTLVFAGSLNAGGHGLTASAEALAQVLDGVALDSGIIIDFNLSPPTRSAVQLFTDLVKHRRISPAKINLCASLNPVGDFAATGATPRPWRELSKDLAASIRGLADQGYRGPFAVADGRIIHNAGGSEVQELAFALSAAVDYLRALEADGISLEAARSMIYFRLAADADQFLTMVKFRAIRRLWARVEESCALTPKPTTVAAETAWRMVTRRDPYVNMLRNTIAVASAALGGADNISVLPHTAALGLPDSFARRIARNTQLILLEESHLAKVADPAAGSGAIEDLTTKLCELAWTKFQSIEKSGGAWAALEQGLIQRDVATMREKRQTAVARRLDAITGVSDYPNLNEELVRVLDVTPVTMPKVIGAVAAIEPLPNVRLAEPFELLRDKSDAILARTGHRPKVFLANLGRLSDFTARATYAKNFYETGGIEVVTNDGFALSYPSPSLGEGGEEREAQRAGWGLIEANPHPPATRATSPTGGEVKKEAIDRNALVAAFKTSGAKLACLCSSDKVYDNEAIAAAKALTHAGAVVHLAGRPKENENKWREAGVNDFIYARCNAFSLLKKMYEILDRSV